MSPADPLLAQSVVFVVAALTGVTLGLCLDAYRALRVLLRPPRWLGHVLDGLFVAGALPVVAIGLLAANWGEVRAYPLAGLLLGGALYLVCGSPVVLPAATGTLRIGLRVLRAVVAGVSWPVRAPLHALRHRTSAPPPPPA